MWPRCYCNRVVSFLPPTQLQMLFFYVSCRPFNAWGDRVDEIVTSSSWKALHAVSAEEGLVALAYERQHGEWRYIVRHTPAFSICNSLTIDTIACVCCIGTLEAQCTHYYIYVTCSGIKAHWPTDKNATKLIVKTLVFSQNTFCLPVREVIGPE